MLLGSPTKSGTGILLEGDWYDLNQLHVTLHRLAERYDGPRTQAYNGIIMALAYEVRHAYDGMRFKKATHDAGTYYGFHYAWPMLISAVNLLRRSLMWSPGQPVDFGIMYSLEAQVKQALQDYDPQGSSALIYLMEHELSYNATFATIIDSQVSINFLNQQPGKKRFRELATLMNDYWNPMCAPHQKLVADLTLAASQAKRPVEEFEMDGWPERVKW